MNLMPIKFDTTTRTPLTEGGEGYIYEYNGKIIKTFKPHIDIAAKERKVNALMKTSLPKAVITPIDTVLDMRGKFIGYCMEKVSGEEFKRLSNRKFVTANNITTKDILGLLVKVKSALAEIHKKNIYVGDLNDQNILFDTVGNIYLIDCDSSAQVNKKPVSQGVVGGLKLYAIYDGTKIKAVFDRYTYLDNEGFVHNGNQTTAFFNMARYHYTKDGMAVLELPDCFTFQNGKDYQIDKKYKSAIEVCGNKIYYISVKNTLTQLEIMPSGNGIKNVCKVSNTAYFAVSRDNYCVVNYYTGKIIVNVNGTNTVIDYDTDIVNYGIHHDEVSDKWLIILEDSKGKFSTFVISGGTKEYQTDEIKYDCQLNCPCIYNSNIFIPVDGKIRGYSYKKSAFKDFECSVVSEESKLIKEKNRFVIVNLENVYYLEN